MNKDAQYWIETAQYDIDTARAMLETKRYLYVGFLCHLTIEKALKAVIANGGVTPPKIHNLIRLANLGKIFNRLSERQHTFLVSLNPLNIEARYPAYKDGIYAALSDGECRRIIEETEALYIWIKEQL